MMLEFCLVPFLYFLRTLILAFLNLGYMVYIMKGLKLLSSFFFYWLRVMLRYAIFFRLPKKGSAGVFFACRLGVSEKKIMKIVKQL